MHGIVVAADLTQEWLLPWWWSCYAVHNQYPVAFVDLGMSFEMKKWCREHGAHIPLRIADFAAEQNDVQRPLAQEWKKQFGTHFWDSRNAWFKKPLACLASPFKQTIWLDLDCEIKGSLAPLFDMRVDLAAVRDIEQGYNSGVILFSSAARGAIEQWAKLCIEQNHLFCGDQDVFNHLINMKKIELKTLPLKYNWSRRREDHPETIVLHWHGPHGKQILSQKQYII